MSSPAKKTDDDGTDSVLGQQIMGDFRPGDLFNTAANVLGRAVQRPVEVAGTTLRLTSELLRIATGSTPRQPEKGDRRFADEAWRSNPLFTRVLQSYLAMESALSEYADHSGGQGRESERSKFLLSQVSSALAPTNFLATNPTALRTAAETGGQSLIKGARNMFNDVLSGRPIPSQVDESQFKVGKNLASTPGSVVARTEMFELIQYIPQPRRCARFRCSSCRPS